MAGQRGAEGPPGRLPLCRAWTDRVYYQGETCAFAGATYQAVRDTGRRPPDEDWTCLAERGTDGRGIRVRGTHNADETYEALDVVMLNGSSFIATRDLPGVCPGDGWQLWASRGSRGERGETGLRGAPGARGDRGEAAPGIVALTVEADTVLTLTLADGSLLTCDLYNLVAR
jgi:hypothetical protein